MPPSDSPRCPACEDFTLDGKAHCGKAECISKLAEKATGREATRLLEDAVEWAERNHPLPRCKHGHALRDHGGALLEPTCGCRLRAAQWSEASLRVLRSRPNGPILGVVYPNFDDLDDRGKPRSWTAIAHGESCIVPWGSQERAQTFCELATLPSSSFLSLRLSEVPDFVVLFAGGEVNIIVSDREVSKLAVRKIHSLIDNAQFVGRDFSKGTLYVVGWEFRRAFKAAVANGLIVKNSKRTYVLKEEGDSDGSRDNGQ